MWRILQQGTADDFVFATNETHTVREFCEAAFEHVDLDWKEFVKHDPRYERPAEVDLLIGNAAKAKKILGWEPKVRFHELVRIMFQALFFLRFPTHLRVASQQRFSVLAEVMKINRIKNDPALWRVQLDVRDMLTRKVASAQHDCIKGGTVRYEVVAHFFEIRMIENFDSTLLQLASVGASVRKVIGNKSDAMAKLAQNLEDLKHSKRSGIVIRHRKMMVYDQNVFVMRRRVPQKC